MYTRAKTQRVEGKNGGGSVSHHETSIRLVVPLWTRVEFRYVMHPTDSRSSELVTIS